MKKNSARSGLLLEISPDTFAICRLPARARVPRWIYKSSLTSVTRSGNELSVVCQESKVPDSVRAERGWRAFRVTGVLDFSLTGVLAALTGPLSSANISLFAISTFDTDYLLVRDKSLLAAVEILEAQGHRFEWPPSAEPSSAPDDEEGQPSDAGAIEAGRAGDRAADSAEETEDHHVEVGQRAVEDASGVEDDEDASGVEDDEDASDVEDDEDRSDVEDDEDASDVEDDEDRSDVEDDDSDVEDDEDDSDVEDDEDDSGVEDDEDASVVEDDDEDHSDVEDDEDASDIEDDDDDSDVGDDEDASVVEDDDEDSSDVEDDEDASVVEDDDEDSSDVEDDSAVEDDEDVSAVEDEEDDSVAEDDEDDQAPTSSPAPADPALAALEEIVLETASKASSVTTGQRDDEGAVSEGMFTGAIPQHEVETTNQSFAELGLSDGILETVSTLGFEHPTAIQSAVIPQALEGRDVVGLAETGSGKTAAFVLPLAERLTHGEGTRGLILCPTREIALQTRAFLEIFGRDHELDTVVVIGGVKMGPQIEGLRRRADIIVATPGRLADHLRRGNASLEQLEELVLDEADHMLDLGFLPQIREILDQAPADRRTMMFSATMPPQIAHLVNHFMDDPVRVDIRPAQQVASGIEHRLYLVDERDKRACAEQLLREVPGSTLIFTRRKLHAEWLARQLSNQDFRVERIHSDRSQARRVRALKAFREGNIRILVATDVAARGIDVPRIEHVINYDLPGQVEDYVHRAGRTARGNSAGIVSSIGTWQDKMMVGYIEGDLGIELKRHTAEGVPPYVELKKKKTVRRRRLL